MTKAAEDRAQQVTNCVCLWPTEDGSVTLYHQAWEVSYRSTGGAVTESRHVFLEGTGLGECRPTWRVLELGFGGGLNFLVTVLASLEHPGVSCVEFWSGVREPLPASLWTQAAYVSWVGVPELLGLIQQVSTGAQHTPKTWVQGEVMVGQTRVVLSLFAGEWQEAPLVDVPVHAVYHDPFDPKVNADAWTEDCFRWSAQQLSDGGKLATYSAAGAVRRAMQAAGLRWRKLPGPGRKREITVASKGLGDEIDMP